MQIRRFDGKFNDGQYNVAGFIDWQQSPNMDTYVSTFDLHGEPRLGVEYQINNTIAVKGERSEGGKYGVDLKLERKF